MKTSLVLWFAGALAMTSFLSVNAATPFYEEVFANVGEGNAGTIANGRLIQAADGDFYGTTRQGAVRYGGCVFRLTPAGKLTNFHAFLGNFNDFGSEPHANVTLGPDGNFYGSTTQDSGNGAGCLFKLTPANKISLLAFNFRGGSGPVSYTQFTLATDGTFYAAIYDTPTYPPTPPEYPTNIVVRLRTNGTFIFMTDLYRLTTGAEAVAPLIEGTDHNFYGTASEGGAGDAGTIFRVTPTGTLSVFHTFHGTDGRKPESSLVIALDGNFYGTTTRGGAHDKGTIFRLTRAGVLTTLVSFAGTNGSFPTGGLTVGADGNLYGTTNLGGQNNKGTFYRLSLSGVLTMLASFNAASGSVPAAGVTLGFDGNFYGIANGDGDYLYGTAYRVTPTGVITKLASFGDNEGFSLGTGVIQGMDGNFYGTTGIREQTIAEPYSKSYRVEAYLHWRPSLLMEVVQRGYSRSRWITLWSDRFRRHQRCGNGLQIILNRNPDQTGRSQRYNR